MWMCFACHEEPASPGEMCELCAIQAEIAEIENDRYGQPDQRRLDELEWRAAELAELAAREHELDELTAKYHP
jgi:hypothetical protein